MYQLTKIYLVITAIFLYSGIFAQSPQGISYQAIARNSAGTVIPNQNISLRFSIHDADANGTIVYSETQSATTNALGLFSLFIGKGTPVTGMFSETAWAEATKFLQVEMDAMGGTAYMDMGTQQMMSVPYSIYADKAGNGTGAGSFGQTLYYNGSKWDSTSIITNDPAGGKTNVKGTLILSNDATAADDRYSIQIETAKPMMFPRMTQSQIDALSPIEGMTAFNSDTHKMQVYAMLTNNADILNEIYTGTSSEGMMWPMQNFTAPISGQVVAIDIMIKDNPGWSFPFLDFSASSSTGNTWQSINIPNPLVDFTWVTVLLSSPLPVVAGSQASFNFMGPGADSRTFATNSFYPNGSGCCFPGADDLLFRIHIQPTPGSYGWQNLN